MTGRVDNAGRALLPISLRHPETGARLDLEAWVDTGFNGHLVLPRTRIESLGLPIGPSGRAVLADGAEVQIDTHSGQIDWFGEWRPLDIIANDGQFPLLGVALLVGHKITIDYSVGTLSVD